MEARRGIPVFISLLLLSGCGASAPESLSATDKATKLYTTNQLLSEEKCDEAIAELDPVYNSADSDNLVRLLMASAYACKANVNFFKLVGDIATNADTLGQVGGFWKLMATLFPASSDPKNKATEAALLATDALLSVIRPGAVILPENYINPTGFNPGATVPSDRLPDASNYLLFVSMAAIGAMENEYGDFSGAGMPWTDPAHADMSTLGCAFASEILHFADGIGSIADTASGNFGSAVNVLHTVQEGVYEACKRGCSDPTGLVGCDLGCTACPITLRDRTKCAGTATDVNSCAAAALSKFVNVSWQGLELPGGLP